MLPNISRSKINQTMKFSQLIECSMRNIFPEKPYTKCGDPFLKNYNWAYLWINSLKFYTVLMWRPYTNRGLLKYNKTMLRAT